MRNGSNNKQKCMVSYWLKDGIRGWGWKETEKDDARGFKSYPAVSGKGLLIMMITHTWLWLLSLREATKTSEIAAKVLNHHIGTPSIGFLYSCYLFFFFLSCILDLLTHPAIPETRALSELRKILTAVLNVALLHAASSCVIVCKSFMLTTT